MNATTDRTAAPPITRRPVVFDYCISCVFFTLWRTSRVHLLKPGAWVWLHGLPYTLATLLLGWWGVPWGPIYSSRALWTNLTGGREPVDDPPHLGIARVQEAR